MCRAFETAAQETLAPPGEERYHFMNGLTDMVDQPGQPSQPPDNRGNARMIDVKGMIRQASARGLDGIGFTIYSLPREVHARIEYLQMIAEDILRPVGALAP